MGRLTELGIETPRSEQGSFQDELCAMLEASKLFADLPRKDLETLCKFASIREAAKGEAIFNEGDRPDCMYVITQGSVRVLKDSGDETKSLTTVSTGHALGEMSIFDNMPYSASAVAQDPARLIAFSHRNLERMTSSHPDLGVKVLKRIGRLMSLRLRHTTGTLVSLGSLDS